MIRIDTELAKKMHVVLTRVSGGSIGVRDEGLIDSALYGAYQTFGGVELYPTVEEKAARLGHSLISNHAFVDGNKRIGMLVMLVFLRINGIDVSTSDEEIFRIGISVASGEMDYDGLLLWIKSFSH